MRQSKFTEGDLLYHPVHGTCRVSEVKKQKQSGKPIVQYSLVPNTTNRMKVRFVIGSVDLGISGFHSLVSLKEANQILDYLKTSSKTKPLPAARSNGNSSLPEQNQTWDLARAIVSLSREKFEAKDQKKRQLLGHSAKGLVGELAFVLKITPKEAAAKVQENLGTVSKNNPLVSLALAEAGGD